MARIVTPTGTEYFYTKPVMTVTKEIVTGDHITEEITYTDALPRKIRKEYFFILYLKVDRLCGLVVRVSGYRYKGLGFDSRRYQIF